MTRCHSESDSGLGDSWVPQRPLEVNIRTPRLLIRCFSLDDVEQMFEIIKRDRDTLSPWVPWARRDHQAVHQTYAFVAGQIELAREPVAARGLALGVFDAETGSLAGGVGFHDGRSDTASCEVGYWMGAHRRGEGLTTEATAHLLSWIFTPQAADGLGIKRVRVYCSAENTASKRVVEKLGLPLEVHQRRDYFVEGHGPTDRLGWGVMAEEWDFTHHRVRDGITRGLHQPT